MKKKINKKRAWINQVIDDDDNNNNNNQKKKKKMKFNNFFLQVFKFEFLYDSSLWVFITIVSSYDYFILLSLSNIFVFIQLLSIYLCFYQKKNKLNK